MNLFEYRFQEVDSKKEMQLNIHIGINGFSFCISNAFSSKLYYISKYQYESDVVKNVIQELQNLSQQVSELSIVDCRVSFFSSRIALLPLNYDNDTLHSLTLDTLFVKNDPEEIIVRDPHEKSDLSVVWAAHAEILQEMKKIHPNVKLMSAYSSFIEKALEIYDPYLLTNSLFFNVEGSSFTLTIFKGKKIAYFTVHELEGPESVLFFILQALKANNLDPVNSEIIYSGCKDPNVLTLLRKYIRRVNPIEMINFTDQMKNLIDKDFIQENFNILSLTRCE